MISQCKSVLTSVEGTSDCLPSQQGRREGSAPGPVSAGAGSFLPVEGSRGNSREAGPGVRTPGVTVAMFEADLQLKSDLCQARDSRCTGEQ